MLGFSRFAFGSILSLGFICAVIALLVLMLLLGVSRAQLLNLMLGSGSGFLCCLSPHALGRRLGLRLRSLELLLVEAVLEASLLCPCLGSRLLADLVPLEPLLNLVPLGDLAVAFSLFARLLS